MSYQPRNLVSGCSGSFQLVSSTVYWVVDRCRLSFGRAVTGDCKRASCLPVPGICRFLVKTPAFRTSPGFLVVSQRFCIETPPSSSMFVSFGLFLPPLLLHCCHHHGWQHSQPHCHHHHQAHSGWVFNHHLQQQCERLITVNRITVNMKVTIFIIQLAYSKFNKCLPST